MAIKTDPYLKSRFEQGDAPDGQDLIDLIDSKVNVSAGSGGEGKNYLSQANAEDGTVSGWLGYNDSVSKSFADTDINTGTDEITVTAHGFIQGAAVYISNALGTNISIYTTYYIIVVNANTIKLSTTRFGVVFNITGSPTPGASTVVGIDVVNGSGGTTGITFTTSLIDPVRGNASFLYTKPASAQAGTGFVHDFTIENADRAKVMKAKFELSGVSGGPVSPGDLEIWIYDITNTRLIQPTPYRIDGIVNGNNNQYLFYSTFQTNNDSLDYRIILHWKNPSLAAATIKMDSFSVGPQTSALGVPAIDAQLLEPLVTQGFGTTTDNFVYWGRRGQFLVMYGSFTCGITTAANALVYLPAGLVVEESDIPNAYLCGTYTRNVPGNLDDMAVSPNTNYILFTSQGSGGLSAFIANTIFAVGQIVSFYVEVAIKGWSSNVVMSSESDGRKVAMNAYGQLPNSYTAYTPMVFPFNGFDTHGKYDDTTGIYTIPVSGLYYISSFGQPNATPVVFVSVNGGIIANPNVVISNVFGETANAKYWTGNIILDLKADDTIAIMSTVSWASVDPSAGFNVFKIDGSASMLATEKVAAKYYISLSSPVSIATSGNTYSVNYDTKIFDTHGAVTPGTGFVVGLPAYFSVGWVFVAPKSGLYRVHAWTRGTIDHDGVSGPQTANFLCIVNDLFSPGAQGFESTVRNNGDAGNRFIRHHQYQGFQLLNLLAGDTVRPAFSASGAPGGDNLDAGQISIESV